MASFVVFHSKHEEDLINPSYVKLANKDNDCNNHSVSHSWFSVTLWYLSSEKKKLSVYCAAIDYSDILNFTKYFNFNYSTVQSIIQEICTLEHNINGWPFTLAVRVLSIYTFECPFELHT